MNTNDDSQPRPQRRKSCKRLLKRSAILLIGAFVLGVAVFLVVARNHIRSLWSFRRVPNTNMYVMDYYGKYNIAGLYHDGVDTDDIPGSLIRNFFPRILLPIANAVGGHVKDHRPSDISDHSCSTVSFRTKNGEVYFGRNFDWMHDPCLIVVIHGNDGPSSVAVLDPYYLQLDQAKLEHLGLFDRLRLLLAPYLAYDGMNQWGVAVSLMSAPKSKSMTDPNKSTVVKPLMERIILDCAHNTDEAVALVRKFNIADSGTELTGGPCHFMITDAGGSSVVVEFVDGKMKVVTSSRQWQISTNHLLFGKTDSENCSLCPRYRIASGELSQPKLKMDSLAMMQTMSSIAVKNWTMWTSVYNLTTGDFQFAYRRKYHDLYSGHLQMQPQPHETSGESLALLAR
jgi:predicted choloylglycine hydrolase